MKIVVVHSCKLQGHIKHEWEDYLGDVGQRCKAKNGEDPRLPPLRDKSVRAWLPKADKHCLMAEHVPTIALLVGYLVMHIYFCVFVWMLEYDKEYNIALSKVSPTTRLIRQSLKALK